MFRTFKVDGMTCDHCVKAVEDALYSIPGVDMAKAHLREGVVDVEFDAIEVDVRQLTDTIVEQGYTLGVQPNEG